MGISSYDTNFLFEEKIGGFLPALEEMMGSGLVTLERVQVLQYGPNHNGHA